MNIETIRHAMLEAKQDSHEPPEFLLLTATEFAAVKSDPEILRFLGHKAGGMADELFGLPVVIQGSAKHMLLQSQNRRALRPNA